jgi:glycerophosphoryl diester phosphodiesterase
MSGLWYHKRTRPLVIAHRGASAAAPESTAAALREAVRAGADMIEVDVQLTRDGRPVFFHDARLERTTNGRGWLRRTRYADLVRLDAGSWFHRRFAGERILPASKGLAMIPARIAVNLELKSASSPHALIRAVRTLLRRTPSARRILLSSFDARLLRLCRPAHRPLALICRRQPDRSLRQAIRLGCDAWHPFHTLVTARRVKAAHAAGLRVHAWTVDDARSARRLLRMGIDGIFTNDPARLARALGRP